MTNEIEYQPVAGSRNVAATAHDPATNTMYVRYHDGAEYKWPGTRAHQHSGLRAAGSVGSHLHKYFPKGTRIN